MKEQEIKALFMAQYFNQKVLRHTDWDSFNDKSNGNVLPCYLETGNRMTGFYLLLRSVSQLTDDERLQVGIVAFPMFVPFPEKDYDTLRKLALTVLERGHLGSRTHQVLVRYGVLVPFTYLNENNQPVTLQPDEIIAKGWAKLV